MKQKYEQKILLQTFMSWYKEVSQPMSNRLQSYVGLRDGSLVRCRWLKRWVRLLSTMCRVPTRPIVAKFFIYVEGGCSSNSTNFETVLLKKLLFFFMDFGVFLFGKGISISQTMAASKLRKKKKTFQSPSKTVWETIYHEIFSDRFFRSHCHLKVF